jgi:hypothetical protein
MCVQYNPVIQRRYDDEGDDEGDDEEEHGRPMRSEAAQAAAKTFEDNEPWEQDNE